MAEEEAHSDSGATGDTSNDDASGSEPELMVTSRTRRTTAGNRYNHVVAQEQAVEDQEDDVALLFAEMEGEDEEYNSDEGADDADMSSSDDDDDQGPNAAADDLEGEKVLQSQAKLEKARKRKAELALTTMSAIRKKPRIDPTSSRGTPESSRPIKRKERVSWLPNTELAPGRSSLRKQTIAHRAETHAKLKENEKQRLKAKARRAEREKEREADAPKALTQADRLAEAERVERRNAKSLNRWEAMEKKRAEEQAARLAALKERKLEGAVVTFHSARHVFNGWRSKENVDGETGEVKKRGRKSKAYLEQLAAAKLLEQQSSVQSADGATSTLPFHSASPAGASTTPFTQDITSTAQDPLKKETVDPPPGDHFLSGIYEFASMDADGACNNDNQGGQKAPKSTQSPDVAAPVDESEIPPPNSNRPLIESEPLVAALIDQPLTQSDPSQGEQPGQQPSPAPDAEASNQQSAADQQLPYPSTAKPDAASTPNGNVQAGAAPSSITASVAHIGTPTDGNDVPIVEAINETTASSAVVDSQRLATSSTTKSTLVAPAEHKATIPADPPLPEVTSIRNLVILDKFDYLTHQARDEISVLSNTRKTVKLAKHLPELCPITGLAVRYRDPITSLGYRNAAAFKKIKELRQHRYVWSSMLGCYIGRGDVVARGVPEGFNG